jgi:hypothetical protein
LFNCLLDQIYATWQPIKINRHTVYFFVYISNAACYDLCMGSNQATRKEMTMNKLLMIQAKDLKPKMVFTFNGLTCVAFVVTIEGNWVEVEVQGISTGLIILSPQQPVIVLGEV